MFWSWEFAISWIHCKLHTWNLWHWSYTIFTLSLAWRWGHNLLPERLHKGGGGIISVSWCTFVPGVCTQPAGTILVKLWIWMFKLVCCWWHDDIILFPLPTTLASTECWVWIASKHCGFLSVRNSFKVPFWWWVDNVELTYVFLKIYTWWAWRLCISGGWRDPKMMSSA
jgi:hypothetical protein